MVQPNLPKCLASHLRLISLGVFNLEGLGQLSKKKWKDLLKVLFEVLYLVKSLSKLTEIPPEIHLRKRLKYLSFFEIYLGEKVLKQDLHLYLTKFWEEPHLTDLPLQKGQLREYFFKH